ncbi:MAG: hypothetical protein KBF99_06770 [Leptospiraceae bacterium]|nr:hypothetical protein [Leptospiraceae bacterium]
MLQTKKLNTLLSILILTTLISYCNETSKSKGDTKKILAALAIVKDPVPFDPDQAAIDAIDADIVNPGPLNMNVKQVNLTSSTTASLGKNFSFSASIESDYNAKNVLIRFIFVNKAQIDAGTTTGLKQFEVLDRIDSVKKGTNSYNFNIAIPDAGTEHSGAYTIFTILDSENKRNNSFAKSGMLSGVKKENNTTVTIDSSTTGTRDLLLSKITLRKPLLVIKNAQTFTKTRFVVSGEAFSMGKDAANVDIEFFFADTSGNKLTSLGNLLVYNSVVNSTSTTFRIASLTANVKKNFDVSLIPGSDSLLTSINSYIQANGVNSLRVYAHINPTGSVSETNAPGGATSNIATVSAAIVVDTATKSLDTKAVLNSSLNTSPLKEYSVKFYSGIIGDKSLFAVDLDFNAYGKMLKNTTIIGHGDAKSKIYLFALIERTLFEAYAHAELIPIRMKDSYVDAEVKVLNTRGDLNVVFKKYETGAKTYYWYTTKYKDKEVTKTIYPFGVPVKLTGKLAGILLSKNKNQLSECNIYNCKPEEFEEGFSETNYKDYSVTQIHIRNNFEINVDPRILIRGFAQAKPDTGITIGLEGQLNVLDIFPVAKATATVRMVNNAYQVEIEFKETLDVFYESLYGKLEIFLEIPYPSVSFWDASIEYYRKYWGIVSWDSAFSDTERLMEETQFLRIHLYTGQVDFVY